jgi:hypothetical protein
MADVSAVIPIDARSVAASMGLHVDDELPSKALVLSPIRQLVQKIDNIQMHAKLGLNNHGEIAGVYKAAIEDELRQAEQHLEVLHIAFEVGSKVIDVVKAQLDGLRKMHPAHEAKKTAPTPVAAPTVAASLVTAGPTNPVVVAPPVPPHGPTPVPASLIVPAKPADAKP